MPPSPARPSAADLQVGDVATVVLTHPALPMWLGWCREHTVCAIFDPTEPLLRLPESARPCPGCTCVPFLDKPGNVRLVSQHARMAKLSPVEQLALAVPGGLLGPKAETP